MPIARKHLLPDPLFFRCIFSGRSRRFAEPMLNSGRIVLPKNDRLFNQLVSLERHVARGGHDVIDHPRDQHDDVANAAMGAAVMAASFGGYTLELLARATALEDEVIE